MPRIRLGHLARPPGVLGAHQLFQEEGIAVATGHDVGDSLVGHLGAECFAHQTLTGAPGKRRKMDHVDLAFRPHIREDRAHIGARDGEHHESRIAQAADGAVEQADRTRITPLHVFEHHQYRVDLGLGAHPALECATGGVGHQHWVLSGGAQGLVLRFRRSRPRQSRR